MNDSISKHVLMEQLQKATENAISYDFKKGLLEAQRIVLNLQEQEEKLYEIKVNVPDDIKERLIHNLQDPKFFDSRRIFAEEVKSTNDCIIAYGDGFESARRLFESKCRDCDFRKFSETFINGIVEVMTKNGIESVEQLSEILGKGNDND